MDHLSQTPKAHTRAGQPLAPQTKLKSHASPLSPKRLKRTFSFAFEGLAAAWRHEPNFRIEVICALLAVVAALVLHVPLWPILLCSGMVLGLELINTAIENIIDLVSPSYHPLAKRAKDTAAAAVLLMAFMSFGVALLLFGPRLIELLNTWL